jgi:hypothetical protein
MSIAPGVYTESQDGRPIDCTPVAGRRVWVVLALFSVTTDGDANFTTQVETSPGVWATAPGTSPYVFNGSQDTQAAWSFLATAADYRVVLNASEGADVRCSTVFCTIDLP